MLEKFDPPGVQERQQVVIDIGLGTGRLFENDTVLPKASLWPLAPIPVADNARDAEAPEDCRAFRDRAFGIKGRAHFKDGIQDTDRAVSRCATASVIASLTPPLGSQNAA